MRYIVITGGVVSGLGKGITASSIALLLKTVGYTVTAIKIDPYINIDAGTMSPFEHGECYVLEDGGEVDLDLGNYERFLNINLSSDHNITTGKVYQRVIRKERNGDYLGKTVQIIPHITNEIQDWIYRVSQIPIDDKIPEFCIIEVGGTVGDMETGPFIESIRQMSLNESHQFCFAHVSLLLENGGELKTKPTQQSMATLRSLGITPNFLILRTPENPTNDLIHKLSIQCHIPRSHIILNTNVPNIYYVPHAFITQNLLEKICDTFCETLNPKWEESFESYYKLLSHFQCINDDSQKNLSKAVRVTIAGKYVNMPDTYLSIIRAIDHASFHLGIKTEIQWLDCDDVANTYISPEYTDVVIIPGGFGSRGIEGKINVARQCREMKIPMLGICLGMQVMIAEIFRANGVEDASSREWNEHTANPVIDLLPNQDEKLGGTMRLGNYTTSIRPNTHTEHYYKCNQTVERHRHRYEFNNAYLSKMDSSGMIVSGMNTADSLVEIVEIPNHPFYIGCQFHPEYSSKNNSPHPLFVGLLNAFMAKSISDHLH
jgi:CTP synthase